jgi:hypothetical protein
MGCYVKPFAGYSQKLWSANAPQGAPRVVLREAPD